MFTEDIQLGRFDLNVLHTKMMVISEVGEKHKFLKKYP